MATGQGVEVLDPHGDLSDQVLARVPLEREGGAGFPRFRSTFFLQQSSMLSGRFGG